jgi:hypothetical protein
MPSGESGSGVAASWAGVAVGVISPSDGPDMVHEISDRVETCSRGVKDKGTFNLVWCDVYPARVYVFLCCRAMTNLALYIQDAYRIPYRGCQRRSGRL